MVIVAFKLNLVIILLGQNSAPLQRLDPGTQGAVLSALALLTLTGACLVLLAWLAARATRHYMRGTTGRRTAQMPISSDDWTTKPLVPVDEGVESKEHRNSGP
jgi:hypothetical protein